MGVEIKGHSIGLCFFADDIVLIATSKEELQEMLDVVAEYGTRWKIRVNAKKCGVLVVGQKKQHYLRRLGRKRYQSIAEVDEYEYAGVWMNRQANGLNHPSPM